MAAATVALLATGGHAYSINVNKGFWGWCPELQDTFPKYNSEWDFSLLNKVADNGDKYVIGDIKCTDAHINEAGKVHEDGDKKG